ncbi:MAG: hypothetical protein ACR2LK_04940 [Solirubrobacteraceae bacterium]
MAGELEAADQIAAFKRSYAATNLGLLVVQHPRREEIIEGILGIDRGSMLRLGRRDNSYYGIDVWESLDAISGEADFNLFFLAVWFMVVLSAVGDTATQYGYWDRTPELEMLRHLRNGVSHGDRFHLLRGAPKRPARFKNFEITPALHGSPVLFEFMSTGDLFDLLDCIDANLRARVATHP